MHLVFCLLILMLTLLIAMHLTFAQDQLPIKQKTSCGCIILYMASPLDTYDKLSLVLVTLEKILDYIAWHCGGP